MTFCFFLEQQNDDVSVAPEKAADMSVSGTGCSDGVVLTEPQSSIGAEVSDAEQGKTTGDIILEKDHVESAVQTGGSAAASPEKSPAAEPSVDVDAAQAQPKVFLFQILQLLLVSFLTTLQRQLETTRKIPKAIAMERRLIIPVLPLV